MGRRQSVHALWQHWSIGTQPEQLRWSLSGTTLDGEVTVSAGIQQWVVPETGTYVVEAAGARGGVWNNGSIGIVGAGARMVGEFSLTQGEVIQVLVGQPAADNPNGNTGGGGGSFVTRAPHNTNASILVIAGGGGGHECATQNFPNTHGTTSSTGQSGTLRQAGRWVQWQWCHRCRFEQFGGGGGGFFTDGRSGTNPGGPFGYGGEGGKAYVNGGVGGGALYHGAVGGFGGGAGAYGWGGGGRRWWLLWRCQR